ncbi:NADAR family protein [Nocardia iowensis]|uniref:NADAR family protein n=1 Tax=Nocardia iowensis TaxID=204891 RepID=A0ABX8RYK7_NOCIO|nr:NADAR family protein [Nocardia iowensis]QXN94754.1 NADAR family protein [Nocardia iowensis]
MYTAPATSVIDQFRDADDFLSNYSGYPVEYRGRRFETAAHAFAAAQSDAPGWASVVQSARTGRDAENLARQGRMRDDWASVRDTAMAEVLLSKFTFNPELGEQLRATGDALLIDTNDDGEQYWGRCLHTDLHVPAGMNMLGRTLMGLRRELRGDPSDRWPRVALTGHREHLIRPGSRDWVRAELDRIAVKLRDEHDTEIASSGLATGSDTWWAESALAAGLTLWGYQPFPEQPARWSAEQQAVHAWLCESAQRLVLVGPYPDVGFFDTRNQLLLTDADAIVAVHDPRITRGGTVSALGRHCTGIPLITVNLEQHTTTINFLPPAADPHRL